MKILLVLGKYLPERNGGIENYSHWLASVLLQKGHEVDVAILDSIDMNSYSYEGVNVHVLKNGFVSFQLLLAEQHYAICHFQEYSAFGGIELFWFKEAKKYCNKVFFTFHLPYFTCYKGDFRYMGIEDCNNFTSPERCTKCMVATRLNYQRHKKVSLRNVGIDLLNPLLKRSRKIRSLKTKIIKSQDNLRELIDTCDALFIYADWFKEILKVNGYSSPSLKKIPYLFNNITTYTENDQEAIKGKILFVGRIEKQKGLHLLCKAMKIINTKHVQLDVFGNIVDEVYFKNCGKKYAFNFKGTLPLQELLQVLPEYDFFILPSVFTEMYSMMIKYSFYAQLPVIVSAAKGNVDAVKEGVDGFIFEYDNFQNLAKVIDHAYTLKKTGWRPSFETSSTSEEVGEIVAYY